MPINTYQNILKKGKDGARQPRTFFALDCYLLGCFSTHHNQMGHWGNCRAGSTPRGVGILTFQTVAMEIGSFYWGRSQAASDVLKTEPGSLAHFLRMEPGSLGRFEDGARQPRTLFETQAASDMTEPGNLGRFEEGARQPRTFWRRSQAASDTFWGRSQAAFVGHWRHTQAASDNLNFAKKTVKTKCKNEKCFHILRE